MALNIIGGRISRPQKLVIYGPEGIGKTSLCAQMPDPVEIDVEDGSAHIDMKRIPKPDNWRQLLDIVNEVAQTPEVCKTLVIDTADAVEAMCIKHICEKANVQGLEGFGYGKGYQYLSEAYATLLEACDKVVANGMNVVFIAHAKMRKMELPDEQGAFDRWELKLSRQVAPLLKEWPDALLFLNYKTMVIQGKSEMDKAKARGGKRVIYTSHSPVWDAKNRHGLPEELPLSYESIAPIFGSVPKPPTAHEKLRSLLDAAQYNEDDLRKIVSAKGHFPETVAVSDYPDDFLTGWVFPNWEKITEAISNLSEHMPF